MRGEGRIHTKGKKVGHCRMSQRLLSMIVGARDFFHIFNVVRQYFRFRSANFFKFLASTKINRMRIYTNFLKIR